MSLLDELLLLQPRMLQALCRRSADDWIVLEHGQKKVGELLGLHRVPVVLLHQHVHQTPGLQLGDVPQASCNGKSSRGHYLINPLDSHY